MINKQLLSPESIVVIGGSNDISKPGGKVLKNIIDGKYAGRLYVVNPKETFVQGIPSFPAAGELPDVDLAIIAIPAKFTLEAVEILTARKRTRAFIIISAGFSEESKSGKVLEDKIVEQINKYNACLIGPNVIGVLTPAYHGVFTLPIPKLTNKGCDFISGSGATACFIMGVGMTNGLSFANVFSMGNSAQIGVEEVLKYMDDNFDPDNSPRVKLLYMENIRKPQMLLKHAISLIRKGCKIAAVKAGTSEAGSRAASSHTGAMASSDLAAEALFHKAGIVRCHSREELIAVASVFMHPELKGKSIAVITHAGGPAVMLTDALSEGGLEVPRIQGKDADELKTKLHPGSSVSNPIDFLATGTAEQLGTIIDYADDKFDEIDGLAVIFGTPGLLPIFDVYKTLLEKIAHAKKPVFPILPSIITAKDEVQYFLDHGGINFPDEVVLGKALTKVYQGKGPYIDDELPEIDQAAVRNIIDSASDGYLAPDKVNKLLQAAGIECVTEAIVKTRDEAVNAASDMGYPVVMKVVGPVHKTDVAGVVLGVKNAECVLKEFDRMIKIKDTTAILIQPMLSGTELFAGAKAEYPFGHLVLFGAGGIFVEVFKDFKAVICPASFEEASVQIKKLKSFKLIEGYRGKDGININKFAEIIVRLSALVTYAPEIAEMDINPLLGRGDRIIAVDYRINIRK